MIMVLKQSHHAQSSSGDAQVLPRSAPIAGKPVHVTSDGGRLTSDEGVLVQTSWAICQPLRVHKGERQRQAEPQRLGLNLAVQLEGRGGRSQVTLRPNFVPTSLNTFTNLEVTQPCRSTGALERDILGP